MWYTVPKVFVVSLDVKLIYCDLACDNTQSYFFFFFRIENVMRMLTARYIKIGASNIGPGVLTVCCLGDTLDIACQIAWWYILCEYIVNSSWNIY